MAVDSLRRVVVVASEVVVDLAASAAGCLVAVVAAA
jgi:hypothetical protein